jgi:hypothetical protein
MTVAARSLTPPLPTGASGRLSHSQGDQTMTYEIECQIEELRAELRNAVDPRERRQIETELDLARAELVKAYETEPPF